MQFNAMFRHGLVLGFILALTGCSIYTMPGSERAPIDTSAAAGLLGKARTASAQGDYEQALALLERAQRIDPNSAEIYLQLARVYAAQGQLDKSRDTASRGTLYCRDERECSALRALAR